MILNAGAVVLRPYTGTDRDALISILNDPEVMRLVLDERALTRDEAEKFLRKHLVDSTEPGFGTIHLKGTGEAIGFAGYRDCHYLDEPDLEFGWVIATPYHGQGYATALGKKLIAHALEAMRLNRILSACNPLNNASEHVLRDKLNMRFERDVEPRRGFRRRVYAAVAAEWRSLNGPDLQRGKNPQLVMTVRPATPSDARAIAELHAESWRSAYRGILRDEFLDGLVIQDRRRLWESRLSGPPTGEARFVALIEHLGELKAFVCALLDADPHWGALLDNLHVSTSAQGKGLGRRLMAEAAGWVLQHRPHSRLHLWVYEENRAARRFYEHLGGVITERRAESAADGSQVQAIRYSWKDLLRLT